MDVKYRYGRRPGRRRRTRVLIVMVVSLLILGSAGAFVYFDLKNNQSDPVETAGRSVAQSLDESTNTVLVDEPSFTMELPGDWKQISKVDTARSHVITWQATKYREDNRYIKIYVDIIPTNYAVNRVMPVTARGNSIVPNDISNNCSTFTKGGIAEAGQAQFLADENAKWQGVDFLCDLAQVTDNEVGTSSPDGINTVTVTGPQAGKHSYFFLYVDHNIQPNYNIFTNAIRSFKAK